MKKYQFIILLALTTSFLQAQKKFLVDTVVDRKVYQSFFNYKLKNPLYVTYSLFKGGGNCDRTSQGFSFRLDDFQGTAVGEDYSGTGYDKGHLANAEDFANECDHEELTFRYYNCVPQVARMNRGIWKKWETEIRQLSQKKKLFVVVGSIFGNKTLGESKIGIPTYCYKIVLDGNTRKILYCLLFPNNNTNTFQRVTEKALKKKLGYDLMPASYWGTKRSSPGSLTVSRPR